MTKYQPLDSLSSPRFSGVSTFMRLPNETTLTDVDFIITGIPFDTGSSFGTGSRFGPKAVREASLILKPYNPALDVNIFDYCSGVDYGDISIIPGFIEDTFEKVEQGLRPVFEKNVIPICIGGDHSITLPELRALNKTKGPVALVHFDSHSDTYDSFFGKPYNHGTTFRRAIEEGLLLVDNSIQIGIRGHFYGPEGLSDARNLGLEVFTAWEIRKMGLAKTIEKIRERVQDKPVFVSFDIDFLDAAYAPGTGTPEIGGFTTWEAQELLRDGLRGLNLIGFDLVEVLPGCDPSKITAYAAAGIMYEFISLVALNKKNKS
jgi:agmatinase